MADPTRRLYGEVTEGRIVEFIEQWMNSLAHLARYSETNRVVAQNTGRLHQMIPEVTDERGRLTIAELHHSLLVCGRPLSNVAMNHPAVAAFSFLLLKHNIRTVSLGKDVSLTDFVNLLTRLAHAQPPGRHESYTSTHVAFGDEIIVELQTPLGEPESVAASGDLSATGTFAPGPLGLAADAADVRQAPGVQVRFVVRVGGVPLSGATVCQCGGSQRGTTGEGDQGAILALPPGEHEVEVHIDEYRVRRPIVVNDHDHTIEIDLQKIFDFQGE